MDVLSPLALCVDVQEHVGDPPFALCVEELEAVVLAVEDSTAIEHERNILADVKKSLIVQYWSSLDSLGVF